MNDQNPRIVFGGPACCWIGRFVIDAAAKGHAPSGYVLSTAGAVVGQLELFLRQSTWNSCPNWRESHFGTL